MFNLIFVFYLPSALTANGGWVWWPEILLVLPVLLNGDLNTINGILETNNDACRWSSADSFCGILVGAFLFYDFHTAASKLQCVANNKNVFNLFGCIKISIYIFILNLSLSLWSNVIRSLSVHRKKNQLLTTLALLSQKRCLSN